MKVDKNDMWHGDDGKFVKKGTAGDHVNKDIDTLKQELIVKVSNSNYTVIDPSNDEETFEDEVTPFHLPKKEYGMVMSNLATHLTDKEYKAGFAVRDIRNNRYYVLIRGFNDYIITGKAKIKPRR